MEEFEREQYAVQSYLWELWTGPIGADAEAALANKGLIKKILDDPLVFYRIRADTKEGTADQELISPDPLRKGRFKVFKDFEEHQIDMKG